MTVTLARPRFANGVVKRAVGPAGLDGGRRPLRRRREVRLAT